MRLLSIELFGKYKGLKDQAFDFSTAGGDVAVLIGMNGSGKSQVMELIAEVFAFLERRQRSDFRVRGPLGYDFRVDYQLASSLFQGSRRYVIDSRGGLQVEAYESAPDPEVHPQALPETWLPMQGIAALDDVLLPRLVGYASGLSENLQRPFMKNSLQFYDVISVRSRLKEVLARPDVDERATIEINRRYLTRHRGIFSAETDVDGPEQFRLRESDTVAPKSLFLDYDCAALLIALLGMLPAGDRNAIWGEIPFRHPARVMIRFDLRGQATAGDNARDIQRLIELAGPDRLTPLLSAKVTEEQFELFQLDYLAGDIHLDFTDPQVMGRLSDGGRDPSQWFSALYKLQLLGVGAWTGDVKKALRRDGFQGHVKKPLKGKLPLSVQALWMTDGQNDASLDDLSDGEVQLLLTLGAVRLFGDNETLFLYDEPETHLNPSWRTRFHLDFERANKAHGSAQALVSSHSPFLVSSLPREAIFHFKKIGQLTSMSTPDSETFGASFELLIKRNFDLKAAISETAIQEIRGKLADNTLSTDDKLEWLETSVGDSVERSYLINKLRAG